MDLIPVQFSGGISLKQTSLFDFIFLLIKSLLDPVEIQNLEIFLPSNRELRKCGSFIIRLG